MDNLKVENVSDALMLSRNIIKELITFENTVLFLMSPILVATGMFILKPELFLSLGFLNLSIISIGIALFTLTPCIIIGALINLVLAIAFDLPLKHALGIGFFLWCLLEAVCLFLAYFAQKSGLFDGLQAWMILYLITIGLLFWKPRFLIRVMPGRQLFESAIQIVVQELLEKVRKIRAEKAEAKKTE